MRRRLNCYRPDGVKRAYLSKTNGRQRPFGVPTIEDRLIQQCILQILEPICEAKFHKCSFGFRTCRNTHYAIARCQHLINHSKNHFVIDISLQGFFENVDHGKLIKQLWAIGIRDKKVLAIISRMLRTEGDEVCQKGITQTGILAPLLANIVLNELDWWISNQWETKKTSLVYRQQSSKIEALKRSRLKPCYIVRYEDDFKIFTDSIINAKKLFIATKLWLQDRLKLEIDENKSKITNLRKNGTDFLGIRMRAIQKGTAQLGYVAQSKLDPKRKRKITKVYQSKLKALNSNPSIDKVKNLNGYTLGIHNYYKVATDVNKDFNEIFHLIYYKYKRLKSNHKIVEKGELNQVFKSFYSGYHGSLDKCCMVTLYPIAYIHLKKPVQIHPETTPYTEVGRKRIEASHSSVSVFELEALRKGDFGCRSNEYIENRISKYVVQQGRCYITGIRLCPEEAVCHHILPLSLDGTDEEDNLVIVHKDIHKLIHSNNIKSILEYSKHWLVKSKMRFNQLRKQANLELIEFN